MTDILTQAVGQLLEALRSSPFLAVAVAVALVLVLVALVCWLVQRGLDRRAAGISFGPLWLASALILASIIALAELTALAYGTSVDREVILWVSRWAIVKGPLDAMTSGLVGSALASVGEGVPAWEELQLRILTPFYFLVAFAVAFLLLAGLTRFLASTLGVLGPKNTAQGSKEPSDNADDPPLEPTPGAWVRMERRLGSRYGERFFALAGYFGSLAGPEPRFVDWHRPLVRFLGVLRWSTLVAAVFGTLAPAWWILVALLHEGLKRNARVTEQSPVQQPVAPEEAPADVAPLKADLPQLVEALCNDPDGPRLHLSPVLDLPARPQRLGGQRDMLQASRLLGEIMGHLGFQGLYLHQENAAQLILQGESVLLATPSLSGRTTLCDLLSLHHLLSQARNVLYVCPSADKVASSIKAFEDVAHRARWGWSVYLHDLAGQGRRGLDLTSRMPMMVFATPESLHLHLMPFLHDFDLFLRSTGLVVLTNLDRYTGVWGSNLAFLFRRLNQAFAAREHRAAWLCTAKPLAKDMELFAEALVGRPLRVVGGEADSAGRAHQTVFFATAPWRSPTPPPVLAQALAQAAGLEAQLMRFEEVLTYQELAAGNELLLRHNLSYLPSTAAEKAGLARDDQLLRAQLLVVHAPTRDLQVLEGLTSHLGSQASLLGTEIVERIGQLQGRDADGPLFEGFHADEASSAPEPAEGPQPQPSMSVSRVDTEGRVIALWMLQDDPLSRLLARRRRLLVPHETSGLRPRESRLVLSNRNIPLRRKHLVCALAEEPRDPAELAQEFSPDFVAREMAELREEGHLTERVRRELDRSTGLVVTGRLVSWAGYPPPHASARLDTVTDDPLAVIDRSTKDRLLHVDRCRALSTHYPGRIFSVHRGRYRVASLGEQDSLDQGALFVVPEKEPGVTAKIRSLAVTPAFLGERRRGERRRAPERREGERRRHEEVQLGGMTIMLAYHDVQFREEVRGIRRYRTDGAFLEASLYDRPIDVSFETRAAVLTFPEAGREVLHGLAHLARVILPALIRHEPEDLDVEFQEAYGPGGGPSLLFVDLHPGGGGFSDMVTPEVLRQWAHWGLEILASCPSRCQEGCPDCLVIPQCHGPLGQGEGLDRPATAALLARVLGR